MAKKLKVEIEIGNEATLYGEDLAELLRTVADQVEQQSTGRDILDYNGNIVGSWAYSG